MREDGRKRVCIVSLKEVHCLCYVCCGCMALQAHAAAVGLCA